MQTTLAGVCRRLRRLTGGPAGLAATGAVATDARPDACAIRPPSLGSTIILVLVLLSALFAPVFVRLRRDRSRRQEPRPAQRINWAGTDVLGRDLFSRIMLGTRIPSSA